MLVLQILSTLLDNPEDLDFVDLEFGLEGKPCYYYYEGDRKVEILSKLDNAVGPDGYTFIDGQPFLNEIDADIELEEIIAFAEYKFEDEDECRAYLFFSSIFHFLNYTYSENIKELEHLFNNDLDSIVKINEESFEDPDLDFKENSEMFLSAAEKYLMYQDVSILYNDIILDAFDTLLEMIIPKMVANINITEIGDKKILSSL